MKKNIFLVILTMAMALTFPSQIAAYDPWCINFSCYGPCRPDCCGYGYEYCRRCPHMFPCYGTVVVVGVVVAAVLLARHHHNHGHSHSHAHIE